LSGAGVDDGDDLIARSFGVRPQLEDERLRGVGVLVAA
jgi:hypothetical protein